MKKSVTDIIAVIALGSVLFLPLLGGVHLFDWDEINFAEAAREMLLTDEYLRVQINYHPFWEKPPMFIWLQALSMHFFGVDEYAARFPNAICGILTLLTLFILGKRHFDRRFGWFWVLAYCGSILPQLYFKSGIIDPWFNLLIFLGIYHLTIFAYQREKVGKVKEKVIQPNLILLLLAGAFIGLAILTKGPAAYLIVGLVLGVNWLIERLRFFISVPQFLLFTLVAAAVPGVWFASDILENGWWFTRTFTAYQWRLFSTPDAGHGGFFGYHFVVLLVGCFPASLLALAAFRKSNLTGYRAYFRRFMLILFWVVLLLFSVVQSKIVHYSSLCYFPLTFLAALTWQRLDKGEMKVSHRLLGSIAFFGILFGAVTAAIPLFGQNIDLLKPLFAADPFALANLDAEVEWTGRESNAGIFLIVITLLSVFFFRKKQIGKGGLILFVGTAIFVQLTLIFFINRIENYSQRAAVEFYQSIATEDAYVATVGFKSYAHLFYSAKKPGGDPRARDINWLLHGDDLDKSAYFVTKIHRRERLDKEPNLEYLHEKNGFVFYRRKR